MQRTKIDWCRNPDGSKGYTSNVITGCNKRCEYCYAWKMARRLKGRFGYPSDDPFKVTFHPDEFREWLRLKRSSTIFLCSMGEFFDPEVLSVWQGLVILMIGNLPQHTFIILTKQYLQIKRFHYPRNVWLGVSVDRQNMAEAIGYLRETDARVKLVSFEPLLEELSVDLTGIDWIIIGGQSGKTFYPEETWIRKIEQSARDHRMPVFEKKNLRKTWNDSPRREFPTKG